MLDAIWLYKDAIQRDRAEERALRGYGSGEGRRLPRCLCRQYSFPVSMRYGHALSALYPDITATEVHQTLYTP